MQVIKRDGTKQEFSLDKIKNAITKACNANGESPELVLNPSFILQLESEIRNNVYNDEISIETIQDIVENLLFSYGYIKLGKAYVLYRNEHKNVRFIKERIDYMERYSASGDNASTASETDSNANVTMKNVANLEGEVYKTTNRLIQRSRMKTKLQEMFPEVASKYEEDLNNHIIYTHDEASSPTLKPYCMAASLYPLMLNGVGNIDGVTPTPPNDIQSFSGQVSNLVFLLSSQVKGAIALGEYFVALNYYVIQEFSKDWYKRMNDIMTTDVCAQKRTIKDAIRKGMKQFIFSVNQPAGNRSYNSPFSNVSFYDRTYYNALFEDFYYPDGTQPEWEAIDALQRIFMELHRELRLIKPLTFPVTTMAMVHDGNDIIDKEYKQLCASEWAKGGSFFAYISDNPKSLASCCRVLNEIQDNTFNSTIGLIGMMTGSSNVITLNLNRIIQDWFKLSGLTELPDTTIWDEHCDFIKYLNNILERVYKYHIAYKTMLYEKEEQKMYSSSNAGYIYLNKLYNTIGLIGYCEAAEFIGLKVSNNDAYKHFIQLIFSNVKSQNKLHSIRDEARPVLFNSEAIPGEGLAVKLYNWDKSDDYKVPSDQNLYSSYFFKQWDNTISVLDKLKLHGGYVSNVADGGQASHIHLDAHLTEEQYSKIIDLAIAEGVNYFTFNIPMSECKDCGHVVNAPIDSCPKCGSTNIDYWLRIIGYLRPLSAYDSARYTEAKNRVMSHAKTAI